MIDPTPHLDRFDSYEQACREFRFQIPQRLNIATAICSRHPDAVSRIALSEVKAGGINTYTFGGLDFLSDKFATALKESNITQGELVVVALPPSAALAIAQLGVLKAGAVVVPLSIGSDRVLLQAVLADSGACAVVVDESYCREVVGAPANLESLRSRFVVRDLSPTEANSDFKDFWTEIGRCSSDFAAVDIEATSAAFIFYNQQQGEIAGVVHSHRSVIGQLSAFEMVNGVNADSVFWTAGDWSSPGELLGALYPAWWYGSSLVAAASDDQARLLRSIERCGVTNVLIPSLLPKSLAGSKSHLGKDDNLSVRTVVAEALGKREWPTIDSNGIFNEVYGRPETGWIVGKCERLFTTPSGSLGRPVPGRLIEIMDDEGRPMPPTHAGHIAVHKSDLGLFTGYYGRAGKVVASFVGDWFLTGDSGYKNEDGDWFISPSQEW